MWRPISRKVATVTVADVVQERSELVLESDWRAGTRGISGRGGRFGDSTVSAGITAFGLPPTFTTFSTRALPLARLCSDCFCDVLK